MLSVWTWKICNSIALCSGCNDIYEFSIDSASWVPAYAARAAQTFIICNRLYYFPLFPHYISLMEFHGIKFHTHERGRLAHLWTSGLRAIEMIQRCVLCICNSELTVRSPVLLSLHVHEVWFHEISLEIIFKLQYPLSVKNSPFSKINCQTLFLFHSNSLAHRLIVWPKIPLYSCLNRIRILDSYWNGLSIGATRHSHLKPTLVFHHWRRYFVPGTFILWFKLKTLEIDERWKHSFKSPYGNGLQGGDIIKLKLLKNH